MPVIPGVNMMLKIDGSLVAAQEDSQLDASQNLIDLVTKQTGLWGATLNGLEEWSISFATVYESDAGTKLVGADGVVSIDITYNATTETIVGLEDLTAAFSAEFNERGGLDDVLWRFLSVTGLAMEISTTGEYRDPNTAEGAAYDLLFTAREAGDPVDFTLTYGALTFSGSLRPGDWTLDTGARGDDVMLDFSLQHDGAITRTGALATGQEALMAAFFNQALVTGRIEHREGGAQVDQSTYWEGNGYVGELELAASRADELRVDGTVEGHGALTRNVFSAV